MAGRIKTKYPGVYYKIKKQSATGKEERIYYIQYRTPDKQQHHEKIGTTSTGLTDAKANAIRTDRMRGKEQTNTEKRREAETGKNKWTVNKLWEEYKATKDVKWIHFDDLRFQKYIKPSFENLEPKEINHFHVAKLRKQLKKQSKQPATERHVLEILRRTCNFGTKQNLCEGLAFTIQMPEVDNEKTEDLTPQQFKDLWKAIEEEENVQGKNFMKMVLFTGMRRGELFKLQWEDINFDRGFIRIKDPKGGKSQEIPLSEAARGLLLSHERPYPKSPFIFPGRYGKQRVNIKRPVNSIRERANLPKDFRPLHGLRHVYASMLASSGKVDMYTLQKLLTHKSPQMTQRYAHLRDETLKKASQVVVDIIQETVKESSQENEAEFA